MAASEAVAIADIPHSQTGEVHLCYDKSKARDAKGGRPLHVLDAEENRKGCEGSADQRLIVTQTGVPGSSGPQGLKGGRGDRGDPGDRALAQGPRGERGESGPPGITDVYIVRGPSDSSAQNSVSLTLPAGTFAISGKGYLVNGDGDQQTGVCELSTGVIDCGDGMDRVRADRIDILVRCGRDESMIRHICGLAAYGATVPMALALIAWWAPSAQASAVSGNLLFEYRAAPGRTESSQDHAGRAQAR